MSCLGTWWCEKARVPLGWKRWRQAGGGGDAACPMPRAPSGATRGVWAGTVEMACAREARPGVWCSWGLRSLVSSGSGFHLLTTRPHCGQECCWGTVTVAVVCKQKGDRGKAAHGSCSDELGDVAAVGLRSLWAWSGERGKGQRRVRGKIYGAGSWTGTPAMPGTETAAPRRPSLSSWLSLPLVP